MNPTNVNPHGAQGFTLQRARSPPIAVRSPIHDRAPPIQLLNPATGRMVNVKPSRTSATAAPLHSGSTLCCDFLDRAGCQAGAFCNSVHVMGKEQLWESIVPTVNPESGTYLSGFHVSCYDPSMVKYLSLPSDTVTPTSGSANYVSMFNEHGENFKARFQVCKMMHDTNTCASGNGCTGIHTSLKTFSGVLGQETHVCDEETLSLYRRLPEDVTVRVYQQNSTDDYNEFSGDQVLLTLGAQQYQDAFIGEGRRIPRKKMQHCAHFRLKRLCRMGPGCKFIHVISLENQPPGAPQPLLDDDIEGALLSQTSHPRPESPRSGAESPLVTNEVNIIVRERSRGAGYRSPLGVNSVGSRTTSPQLPPSQPKAKGMGPGDVAAMLAMRINNNSGAVHSTPPPISPACDGGPLTEAPGTNCSALPPSRSPTRHNPYQQPLSGSSSTNSSFAVEAKSGSTVGPTPIQVSSVSIGHLPQSHQYSNPSTHSFSVPAENTFVSQPQQHQLYPQAAQQFEFSQQQKAHQQQCSLFAQPLTHQHIQAPPPPPPPPPPSSQKQHQQPHPTYAPHPQQNTGYPTYIPNYGNVNSGGVAFPSNHSSSGHQQYAAPAQPQQQQYYTQMPSNLSDRTQQPQQQYQHPQQQQQQHASNYGAATHQQDVMQHQYAPAGQAQSNFPPSASYYGYSQQQPSNHNTNQSFQAQAHHLPQVQQQRAYPPQQHLAQHQGGGQAPSFKEYYAQPPQQSQQQQAHQYYHGSQQQYQPGGWS